MPIDKMPGKKRFQIGERVSILVGDDWDTGLKQGTVMVVLDDEATDLRRERDEARALLARCAEVVRSHLVILGASKDGDWARALLTEINRITQGGAE